MGNCLQAAIEYATKYGWAVFPVSARTKKPLTPHGCNDAKKDVGAIKAWWRRWPDASVGIATGRVSKLIVIDEDIDEDAGLDGYHEVTMWEHAHKPLPETVMAITGRGGSHLYYRYRGTDEIKNRTGILPGVDVRGDGGYVVAPPSIHPNGTEYSWEVAPEDIEMAEVDDAVLELLATGTHRNGDESFRVPDSIPSGERNDTLFRLACSLQAQGIPDAAIMAAVSETNKKSCNPPLEESELEIIIESALKYQKGELKVINSADQWREPKLTMAIDKNGNPTDRPAQTIANAEEAIAFDPELFGRIRYNEVAYSPVVYGSLPWKQHKGWREWTNADDSNLRSYIENKYKIKSSEKIMDALTNVASRRPVNPIKEMLENAYEQWDGNKYVENLLPMMLGAEKTEYTIAVMWLFMLGAVSRIYYPGCKFDYMPVLVGGQGLGKSTFLDFLSINSAWFNDNFNTLEGDKAFEKLRGMWIVELAELQATRRAKDVESIKSFITSRIDTYRAPYGRRTEQHPRMCVLAGTSNPTDFLTDKTGNRRFLPVTCGVNKPTFNMFENEVATKAVFIQAWGEVMSRFKQEGGNVSLLLAKPLENEAIAKQAEYLEEDPRIGIIQEYLDENTDIDRVCAMMLWKDALTHEYEMPRPQDINAIHSIMRNEITGWVYIGRQRIKGYGVSRCYERLAEFVDIGPEDVHFD